MFPVTAELWGPDQEGKRREAIFKLLPFTGDTMTAEDKNGFEFCLPSSVKGNGSLHFYRVF